MPMTISAEYQNTKRKEELPRADHRLDELGFHPKEFMQEIPMGHDFAGKIWRGEN